ncbi:mannitol dehydrogenase family protein [uncultured Tateyamaria sp.]|uniref:mannitol dehydrogenase family protein n=1 Tax=uncultured Tateyamaria sp. TaxID=455651 RepID=UPI0026367288|nr:mannitol dehydrogenase family protein [uncultured Tateyamaria sp.]
MTQRILHLGVGNFFRAHHAWYTQSCPGWRITGVSFRSPDIRDRLSARGYNYALVIKDAAGTQINRITCMDRMLVVAENPGALLAEIADAAISVITLTVTEKGYRLGPDGTLDMSDRAIQDDLRGGAVTPVGALARGLAMRRTPVTVLSCDNLPDNGRKLGQAVAAFADAASLTIPPDVAFPSCMVDRITPATTDDIRAEAQDPMAVPTEAFTEWVIEDEFAGPRPNWPGVQWVQNVAPHEMRKLRMLNGAHSYLAYAGTLRGHEFVHEAIADPVLRAGARGIMAEAATTLPEQVQTQAADYADALITRFENPNLNHRLRQIAMDGSQKLPIRILATMADRKGQASPALNAAVDAWLHFVQAEVAAGRQLDDPMVDALASACATDDPETALRVLIGAN